MRWILVAQAPVNAEGIGEHGWITGAVLEGHRRSVREP